MVELVWDTARRLKEKIINEKYLNIFKYRMVINLFSFLHFVNKH